MLFENIWNRQQKQFHRVSSMIRNKSYIEKNMIAAKGPGKSNREQQKRMKCFEAPSDISVVHDGFLV